jgi:hypothetical protein
VAVTRTLPTTITTDPAALTPVEDRGGHLYKRDDLLVHPSGVNGGKWRKCLWLVQRLAAAGRAEVVAGGSVHSPQLARTAVAAAETGLACHLIIGGTTVERALRHPSPRLAAAHGAHFEAIRVGYNPALQGAARRYAAATGAGVLHYGVQPEPGAPPAVLRTFHALGGDQVRNLPSALRCLIFPFGSGVSAASLLYGLSCHTPAPDRPHRIRLVGVGPSRWDWLWARLTDLGVTATDRADLRRRIRHDDLIGNGTITFAQRVRYTTDGITLHPTYEAKVGRWMDQQAAAHPARFPGWAERDGTALLWIIGAEPDGQEHTR